jgi:hypothetical protein
VEGTPTGFPALLKFAGGKVQVMEQTLGAFDAKGSQLNEN